MTALVMVVEDDTVSLMAVKYVLQDTEFRTADFTTLAAALEFVTLQIPDLAILAPALDGESTGRVAYTLRKNGVPFVWLSENRESLPKPYRKDHLVTKPFIAATLLGSLTAAYLASHRGYHDLRHEGSPALTSPKCPQCEMVSAALHQAVSKHETAPVIKAIGGTQQLSA